MAIHPPVPPNITNLELLSLEYRATGGNILISEYPIILGDLINLKTLWLYVWSNDNELGETIYINIPSEVYNLISLNDRT